MRRCASWPVATERPNLGARFGVRQRASLAVGSWDESQQSKRGGEDRGDRMRQHSRSSKLHPTALDSATLHVAAEYAEAIYDAAESTEEADRLRAELQALIEEVLDREPQFEQVLNSPLISESDKEELLRRVFEGRVSQLMLNFLLVLNRRRRLELLRAIWREFCSVYDERRRRVPVEVESAVPLDRSQLERLRELLARMVGGEPIVNWRVSPGIIGGLVIRLDDRLYDGSVRTQLDRIRTQILQRSTHEIQSGRDQFGYSE